MPDWLISGWNQIAVITIHLAYNALIHHDVTIPRDRLRVVFTQRQNAKNR